MLYKFCSIGFIAVVFLTALTHQTFSQDQRKTHRETKHKSHHRLFRDQQKIDTEQNKKLLATFQLQQNPHSQQTKNIPTFSKFSSPLDSVHLGYIKRYSSFSIPSYDDTYKLSIDGNGNIFVLGLSQTDEGQNVQWLVKYNSEGIRQWDRQIVTNAYVLEFDLNAVLLAENDGSVYVCAEAITEGDSYELKFLKIRKYSPEGEILWDTTYNWSEYSSESVSDIARDNEGNVIISGEAYDDDDGEFSFLTLKISPSGIFQWTSRFDTSSSEWIARTYIALDAEQNVCVVGNSFASDSLGNSKPALAVRKLDAITGNTIWQQHFFREGGNYPTIASGITVDDVGKIIAVGSTYVDSSSYDFTTLKYSPSGDLLWSQVYVDTIVMESEFPNDVATDKNGNIYVTGSYEFWEEGMQTIKYSPTGNFIWRQLYFTTGTITLVRSQQVLVDSLSNAYCISTSVSGGGEEFSQYTIMKYDSNGTQLWNREFPVSVHPHLSDFSFDNVGNLVYAFTDHSDSTSEDFRIVKISPNDGTVIWDRTDNHTFYSNDYAVSFCNDSLGNNFTLLNNRKKGTILIKFDNAGNEKWVWKNISMIPVRLDVDKHGNSFCVVRNADSLGYFYLTMMINSQGVQSWSSKYYVQWDYPGYYPEDAVIKTDNNGNAYVLGTEHTATDQNLFLIKYNSQGTQEWVEHYSHPSENSCDYFLGLDFITQQKIVITSSTTFSDSIDFHEFISILCFDANGNQLWTQYFLGDSVVHSIRAYDMKTNNNGKLYILGNVNSTPSPYSYFILQYDTVGNLIQTVRNDSSLRVWLDVDLLLLDNNGNMYVGRPYSNYPNYHVAFDKYNSSGIYQWTVHYTPQEERCFLRGATLDNSGNVYFTVNKVIGGTTFEYYAKISTVKINPSGQILWDVEFVGYLSSYSRGILRDVNNNIFVVGGDRASFFLLKYFQTNVSVNENGDAPLRFSLSQNYPNPFNPSTIIRFSIPHESFVSLIVYNILGEKIATLVSERKTSGEYRVEWNAGNYPSGIYFYRLQAEELSKTKKLILTK